MNLSNIKSDNYLFYSIRDKNSKIFENNNEIGKFTKNILSVIYEKKFKLLEEYNSDEQKNFDIAFGRSKLNNFRIYDFMQMKYEIFMIKFY